MNQHTIKQGFGRAVGKIILFGEHAVVYGKPAIAIPVQGLHTDVTISNNSNKTIQIHAKDIGLNSSMENLSVENPIRQAIELSLIAMKKESVGFDLSIQSTIPVASGMGSGAAVSVAIVKAFQNYFDFSLSLNQINQIAYEVEKIHHGTPSGIDNTTITFEKPVYYQKEKPIGFLPVHGDYHFIIANSGVQASTKEVVLGVKNRFEKSPKKYQLFFDQIGLICENAKQSLQIGDVLRVGELMNENQTLLQEISVSSPILESLLNTAREAGAMGAKLSGAGVGGNIIALVSEDVLDDVCVALEKGGSKHVFRTILKGSQGILR